MELRDKAMTITYEILATTTLSTATYPVTFSSIPSTYTDLVISVAPIATNNNYDLAVRYNSDSGSNYSMTTLMFNADNSGNPYASREGNASSIRCNTNINSTNIHPAIIQIQNYSNTNIHKTSLSRTGVPSNAYGVSTTVGVWRNTSAINEITFLLLGGGSTTFKAGTVITLYGIKAE
jgi:hypothetical protein